MAGLAGDDLFFGDDGDGEEFCYGSFDVEGFSDGVFDAEDDDDREWLCHSPFGGGNGGVGEEFCVSALSLADLSDLSSLDVLENRVTDSPYDDSFPQTLAGSASGSFDSDGDLGLTLPQLVSAMRLSPDVSVSEDEEEPEILGGHGGSGDEGLVVSRFELDTPTIIGDLLGDLQAAMGAEEVLEVEEEQAAAGNGGSRAGFVQNGFDLGYPGVTAAAPDGGFRLLVDADDADSDDGFEFVEVLAVAGQVGEAAAGAGAGTTAPPLTSSSMAVESLPEATFSGEEASRGCAVCKDCFESGQLAALLPCKHSFHGDCIWPWLAIRDTCPVCRHQLRVDDAAYLRRMARRVVVLAPLQHQDAVAPAQSGDDRTTMGS